MGVLLFERDNVTVFYCLFKKLKVPSHKLGSRNGLVLLLKTV